MGKQSGFLRKLQENQRQNMHLIVAANCAMAYEAQFRRRAADILRRALYGEVAHE